MFAGFNMVVLLAAIHAIPADYLEAARVDGAGAGSGRLHIMVPLLRPTLVNLAILDFIGKMKQFALVWVMTRGGPMWGTETVATYVVKRAFEWKTLDLGYPSAIAVIWFVIIFGLSYVLHARPAAARGAGVLSVRRRLGRWLLLVPVLAYTAFSAGPYVWTAMMSLRTTDEIYRSHYGLPIPPTGTSTTRPGPSSATRPTSGTARSWPWPSVILVTVLGRHGRLRLRAARYAFPLREPLFLLIFLSIMFPPQIMLLSLFQILVQYRLFNTLTGLILVYAATELPLTIYLLRAFFAQIPTELEEAARHRRLQRLERCSGASCSRWRCPPWPPP